MKTQMLIINLHVGMTFCRRFQNWLP